MARRYTGGFLSATEQVTDADSANGIFTLAEAQEKTALGNFPSGDWAPQRSLRFKATASTKLSRTIATTGSQTKCTVSVWFKRAKITSQTGSRQELFSHKNANYGNNSLTVTLTTGDQLQLLVADTSNNNYSITTSQVFRDTSSWYHLVYAIDSTAAVSSDRMRVWINGQRITSFSSTSYPSQNATLRLSDSSSTLGVHSWGVDPRDNTYFEGYMSEAYFVDGYSLEASYFGKTHASTGTWVPKLYTGSVGTNGHYLPFKDVTSANALGKSYSAGSNLLLYSEQFQQSSTWQCPAAPVATVVTANAATDPLGGSTADLLTFAGGTTHPCYQSTGTISNNIGAVYTFSCYVKTSVAGQYALQLAYFNGSGVLQDGYVFADFNGSGVCTAVSPGGTGGSLGAITVGSQSVGNGWYRVWATHTLQSNGSTYIRASVGQNSGASSIYVWGAQLNNGTLLDYGSTTTVASSNDFTATNLTVSGGDYWDWDQMYDVPGICTVTPGRQNRGNYPIVNVNSFGSYLTATQAGLYIYNNSNASYRNAWFTTVIPQSGKYYWEVTLQGAGDVMGFGIAPTSMATASDALVGNFCNQSGKSPGFYTNWQGSAAGYVADGASEYWSVASGDVINFAYNAETGELWIGKNGAYRTASGTALVATTPGTGKASRTVDAMWRMEGMVPYFMAYNGTGTGTRGAVFNFGQKDFRYTPPEGFMTLCTTSMPDPIIKRPSDHFDVKTYVGGMTTLDVGNTVKQSSTINSKSIRFVRANSSYMSRTPVTAGNQQKFTFATWFKRTTTDNGYLFTAGTTSSWRFQVDFYNNNLEVSMNNGSWIIDLVTSGVVFNDNAKWHHIVVAVDTTQIVPSQRVRVYIDGVEITSKLSGVSWPTQNLNTPVNDKVEHTIGISKAAGAYFDGYMSEVYLIDGQQLTPSQFAQFDAFNNWVPKAYTGTYGTNGVYLPFTDTSVTDSLPTLTVNYGVGLGGWTVVNKVERIPNNTVVDAIGCYSNSSESGKYNYIVRSDGGTSYTVVAQTASYNHPGTGLLVVPLTSQYTIPSTGTYYMATYSPGSGLNWGHDSNSSTTWHYYNGALPAGTSSLTSYSSSYYEPALVYVSNTGVGRDYSGNKNTWWVNTGAIRTNSGYDVTFTEGDGSTYPTHTGGGALSSNHLSSSIYSLPSASNEYLSVTLSPAKTITTSLKFYFDIDKTWANGRNLYINGTQVNTANITTRRHDFGTTVYEWSIDLAATGITSLTSFTTPQNSGGRAVFYAVQVDNSNLIAPRYADNSYDSPNDYDLSGNSIANYPVINQATASSGTISEGGLNLTAQGAAAYWGSSTIPFPTTGKWYFEIYTNSTGGPYVPHNLGLSTNPMSGTGAFGTYLNNYGQAGNQNNITNFSGSTVNIQTTGLSYYQNIGDTIQFAWDADAGKAWLGINNSWVGSAMTSYNGNPSAGTEPTTTITPGTVLWAWTAPYGSGTSATHNFGQHRFKYTPPTGFISLNTKALKNIGSYNLPDNFGNFVNTPDLVWTKARTGGAVSPRLYDTVRGPGYSLGTNSNGGSVAETNPGLKTFLPNGFQLYSPNGAAPYGLESGYTYAAWCWNKGVTPGFDIVTYGGNSDNNAMIPHNLGVTPAMYVTKCLTSNNSTNGYNDWSVWHKDCPVYTGNSRQGKQPLWMMSTAAASNAAGGFFNNPTNTAFGPNQNSYDNVSGHTYIAYLWAEVPGFSKFGSYVGNSSSDGPFIYCGFRPKFLMIKISSGTTGHWYMWDSVRDTYNPVVHELLPSSSAVEYINSAECDLLSNGFKMKSTFTDQNYSGYTYIYAAFAETPFKYANAR